MQKNPYVLILLEASREYGRGLMRGIANYSSLHGPWIIEREIPFYLTRGHDFQHIKGPSKWLVDGVIARDTKYVRKLQSTLTPVVFASFLTKESGLVSCLLSNDKAVGKMGAQHFLERGFSFFAYVGYDEMFWSINRGTSFCKEIRRHNFEVQCFKQASKKADREWINEQFLLSDWLKSLPKPCAVFCCNDDRAQQVAMACRYVDLKVPENIAILGVDNDEIICTLTNPPISSIALNLENAGFQAAQLLERMMSGKMTENQTIIVNPLYVVTRQSSDILAIKDQVVADAVSYIRRHCKEPIQVTDVLQAVSVSKRCLYDKFKRELQCGIYSYIKNQRIKQIERLLIETDMSVSRIAIELGFTSADHIAQYFRSQRDFNPLEFRQRYQRKI